MLLTIVTPCLNSAQYIEEAIQSVLNQDYSEVEHIIVDGGSRDGTLDILSRYEHLKVISEPDQGLYDALNKGIAFSKGDVIGHLNSDDLYAENVFGEIMKVFESDLELKAVYGGAVVFEDRTSGSRRTIAEYLGPKVLVLSFRNILMGVPIINARFFRKRVYEKIGFYDLRYPIGADRDFLIRVALADLRCRAVNRIVYCYRQHPGSLTFFPERPRNILSKHVGTKRLTMTEDYMRMSEDYMRDDALPIEVRRQAKLWHTRESAEGAFLSLRQRRCRDALSYAARGFKYDRLWGLAFGSLILTKTARLIFRGRVFDRSAF